MKRHCKFIPDDILEKLGDKDSSVKPDKDLSEFIRDTRNFLQDNPDKKATLKKKYYKTTHKEVRRLFDCANALKFTTTPIAVDEQIHSHVASKYPALQFANIIYDYFHDRFDLESFDNKNAPIDVHVNFGKGYNNAFWDGIRQVFGNGDGKYFNPFLSQNIFSHELGHAITEHCVKDGGLKYENQSGALNEHYSDVWAVVIDQRLKKQKPSQASWLIGEGLFTSKINGKALRTFKAEKAYENTIIGTDQQPWHMRDYKQLPNTSDGDYGGVHIFSKIPNHAFYLFCMKAEKEVSDERINYSWRAPSEIWFHTYKRLEPITEFKQFALDTIAVSKRIHPQLTKVLQDAWREVGLYK